MFTLRLLTIGALLGVLGYLDLSSVQGIGNPRLEGQVDASDGDRLALLSPSSAGHAGTTSAEGRYDLRSRRILTQVILLIKENYVDPSRIKPPDMLLASLDQIEKTVPEIMVDASGAPKHVKVFVGNAERDFDLTINYPWEIGYKLRDVFEFIQDNISPEQDLKDIEYAAINGMLSTLDPHSVLLKPESFEDVKMATKGEFGGLGISIAVKDGALTIISPMEGTPASRAGLKALDKITQIGEESTINMSIDEAVQRLRGKPNTKVQISVMRQGWNEAKKFMMTRAIIKIESVSSELLSGNVGYIRLRSFQQNSFDDVYSHLGKLKAKAGGKLKGLVFDLRNNPGGLLDQAILISDLFIASGPLVITVGEGNKKREEKDATLAGTETELPVVTLISGGSASASEIVSGALKNHNRSVIVGQQSFGKGSVQVLYDFKDQSALKLTIAQYLTPGDISIQSVGITPDVVLHPGIIDKAGIMMFAQPNMMREKDLEKHLDRQNDQKGLTDAPPTETLTYLLDPKKQTDSGDADELVDSSAADKFTEDFEIKFAKELAQRSVTPDRRRMLENAEPLFKKYEKELDDKVTKTFAGIGIDWAPGTKANSPDAPVTVSLQITLKSAKDKAAGAPVTRLKAGDEIVVTATAKNEGTEELDRVYGITQSDDPMFDQREFIFGKLAPQQSRTWELPIKVPKDSYTRTDEIKIKLNGFNAKTANGRLLATNDELASPHFAFHWQLHDEHGNGDGVLQVGEDEEMRVTVKNVGRGTAQETLVTLKNLAGENVYIVDGRAKLGALAPNEEKEATLHFSVKSGAKKDADLRLSVIDTALQESVGEKISFDVGEKPTAKTEPKRGFAKITADRTPILAGAGNTTDTLAYAKAGTTLKIVNAVSEGDATFYRVSLDKTHQGYVASTAAEVTTSENKASKKLVSAFPHSSPDVVITEGMRGTRTLTATVPVRGTAIDAHAMRDIFVFVNDKKVYYKSAQGLALGEDGLYRQPFETDVPLKVGANTIKVFAREDEDTVALQTFVLFRDGETSVASANSPPSDKQ